MSKKDVMSFLGQLNYINRFIAQSTIICEPIFKMLRKDAETSWTEDCQKSFDKIKEYMSTPPVLVPTELRGPLLLYLSVLDGAFGCVLGQLDETGRKEQAIYYLSKKFTPYEARYSLLECTCYALTWTTQKLRHYLCAYTTYLISRMDPLKYIFQKPMPTGEDITEAYDGWRMFFDGAVNFKGALEQFWYQKWVSIIRFILVAIDYFTKCVEATSYKAVTKKVIADFVKDRIVCRFEVSESIITENAANLNSDLMKAMCETFKIKHKNSIAYRPQMNGAVEAANKNIKKILRKMVGNHKQWHEKLPFALLGCRTTVRTSTVATPNMLVYGTEAVILAEVEIPSLRVIQEAKLSNAEWIRGHYEQLDLIDGKRMNIVCHGQLY
ncbi:uncharacterized protein [Nicotiana sylvestris]|uniref:uncharacterized protein n=1 Tax=Nicotiana sylvestris TaxID=4096 RepID=UPI00388C5960